MEFILAADWMAVSVGAIVAFAIGMFWYSPKFLGTMWMKEKSAPFTPWPLPLALIAQAGATFLHSWVIALAFASSLPFTILVALMISGTIKAGGLFDGKGRTAILVEVCYSLVMSAVMIAANILL